MAARPPGADVVEVLGAGHWPKLEAHETFADAVCRFFDGEGLANAPG